MNIKWLYWLNNKSDILIYSKYPKKIKITDFHLKEGDDMIMCYNQCIELYKSDYMIKKIKRNYIKLKKDYIRQQKIILF